MAGSRAETLESQSSLLRAVVRGATEPIGRRPTAGGLAGHEAFPAFDAGFRATRSHPLDARLGIVASATPFVLHLLGTIQADLAPRVSPAVCCAVPAEHVVPETKPHGRPATSADAGVCSWWSVDADRPFGRRGRATLGDPSPVG